MIKQQLNLWIYLEKKNLNQGQRKEKINYLNKKI